MPGPVDAAAYRVFERLSAARRSRIFHPAGIGYDAAYAALPAAAGPRAAIFDEGFRHAAVARFSCALGLPRPLPDFLGLALRLPDVYGPGRHQDFLLVASGDGLPANHLPRPASTFFTGWFSSLLPYRIDGRRVLVGASVVSRPATEAADPLEELAAAAAAGPIRFVVSVARPWGRWSEVAVVTLQERIGANESARLRFNPWHAGGGVAPDGPINRLRDPAYRGSQSGRPTG